MDSGSYLANSYGKYAEDLTFLVDMPNIMVFKKSSYLNPSDLNLDEGKYSFREGEYFVSKKGTNCFRFKKDGPHLLVEDEWGGAFNKYRGGNLKRLKSLYYKRASSNGGGSGYDYAVIERGTRLELSEDDI